MKLSIKQIENAVNNSKNFNGSQEEYDAVRINADKAMIEVGKQVQKTEHYFTKSDWKKVYQVIQSNLVMKTVERLREDLKKGRYTGNDGSLLSQVHENVQWAWDNWEVEVLKPYYTGEKPENYPQSFFNDWVDNEDFDMELEQINNPA